MRLGFHYHVPAITKDDGTYMPGYFGRFIDSLASYCNQVICFLHTPRPEEVSYMDYRIVSDNVRLVGIGIHASVMERTIKSKAYTSFLRRYASEMDVLLVRGASPLLPAMVTASPVPTALLLVSDYVAGIPSSHQPLWRKEVNRLWCYWNRQGQNRAARHSLTFVNSQMLYDNYRSIIPNLILTRTTTLHEQDFFEREDTCMALPHRLLYAGRMAREKGLVEIVEALSSLVQAGFDVILDLVGMIERNDPILNELKQRATALGVGERVTYHGYKAAGPELLAYYRRADVYVIASQSTEGFPRTIWEAMASSVPVVATQVGSIPAFIQGAAFLVPPKQPQALAAAIREVFTNSTLRKSMIQRGMALTRDNTLEKRGKEMIGQIDAWLQSENKKEQRNII